MNRTVPQTLARIQQILRVRGHQWSLSYVAKLLATNATTVWRWRTGKSVPRGKRALALEIFYRVLVKAESGDPDALKILEGAASGVLGLGIRGVLIAAGLGWLMCDLQTGEGESSSPTSTITI